jgi:hypothetical protein
MFRWIARRTTRHSKSSAERRTHLLACECALDDGRLLWCELDDRSYFTRLDYGDRRPILEDDPVSRQRRHALTRRDDAQKVDRIRGADCDEDSGFRCGRTTREELA